MVKKKKALILLFALIMMLSVSCASNKEETESTQETNSVEATTAKSNESTEEQTTEQTEAAIEREIPVFNDKVGTYYEIYVGSFYDSDGDKMGDLNGVAEKLSYLNDGVAGSPDSLHVDGIWLMPIMPSPTYHKYDVMDYYDIDPQYGTLDDFKNLVEKSHEHGIRVIIDLVMNHTSTEHSWFKQAVQEYKDGNPTKYAYYYNFSETKLGSTYYSTGVPDCYYEGAFWSGMPDLNFDNPDVRKEFEDIVKYWFDMGVDGFRLDATTWVYPYANENIEFWTWFNDYCRSINPDSYIVGEAWSNDTDIINYHQSGFDSFFNFGFAQKEGIIATAVINSVGADFSKNVERWQKLTRSKNSDAIAANFISNHDNDRSAPYFSDDSQRKMAAALYLLAPGNPFIYYGEEIAMKGNGRDENKRAPMIWSLSDSTGITSGPKEMDQTHTYTEGVAEAFENEDSLLNFYIEVMNLKNSFPEIARGDAKNMTMKDRALAVYRVTYEDSSFVIAHNLDSQAKTVPLPNAKSIGGFLSIDGGEPTLANGELELPALGTAIIIE